jgi:hypothetical protein
MAILDWRKPLRLRLQAQSTRAQADHGTPHRTTVGCSVSTHSFRVRVSEDSVFLTHTNRRLWRGEAVGPGF